MRALCYVRVSTDEQQQSGLSLAAQRETLERECDHRGWDLVDVLVDVASGRSTRGRKGLEQALSLLASGSADVLVVTRLDRLARSSVDFGLMLRRAEREKWALSCLDLGVDTTTASGKMIASVVAAIAEWESNTISERTRVAMAQLPRNGRGRTTVYGDDVRGRVHSLRGQGLSLRAICAALKEEGFTTLNGSTWHPATVDGILKTA